MHHILDVTYDEDRCKLLSKRAQENLNIFRKMGISIHKNYLKNKKQTVKSSMFNCLLNDYHLMEILQNCNILWNDPVLPKISIDYLFTKLYNINIGCDIFEIN